MISQQLLKESVDQGLNVTFLVSGLASSAGARAALDTAQPESGKQDFERQP